MKRLLPSRLLLSSLISILAGLGFAEETTFVIDPGQSSVTLSGTVLLLALQEQAPGSMTTTYSGTIKADVTETTVEFIGGSSITPDNNGDWAPGPGGVAGTAPGNYGATGGNVFASGNAALRNLLFDVTSDVITLLNGTFAADGLEFSFPDTATSTADYRVTGLANYIGTEMLAGRSTNDVLTAATIMDNSGELVLTIPIDYTLTLTGDLAAQFRLVGQIVGTASGTPPLQFNNLTVTPGQLGFSIPTTPGKTYTVLGSTDLLDFSTVIDQFTATDTQTARDIAISLVGQQFFILTEE